MKDISSDYEKDTGLPTNKDYLECGLPTILQTSLDNMIKSWERVDNGEEDWHWDIY